MISAWGVQHTEVSKGFPLKTPMTLAEHSSRVGTFFKTAKGARGSFKAMSPGAQQAAASPSFRIPGSSNHKPDAR